MIAFFYERLFIILLDRNITPVKPKKKRKEITQNDDDEDFVIHYKRQKGHDDDEIDDLDDMKKIVPKQSFEMKTQFSTPMDADEVHNGRHNPVIIDLNDSGSFENIKIKDGPIEKKTIRDDAHIKKELNLTKKDVDPTNLSVIVHKMKLLADNPPKHFTHLDIDDLCSNISLLQKNGHISSLSEDEIKCIITIFHEHMGKSKEILKPNLIHVEGDVNGDKPFEQQELIRDTILSGISSSIGLLLTITTKDLDKSLVDEEIIENVIYFLKNSLKYYLFPNLEVLNAPVVVDLVTPDSKRKKVSKPSNISKHPIYGFVLKINESLERLTFLVDTSTLPDSMVISIIQLGLDVFYMDNTLVDTQQIVSNLILTLFYKYSKHRPMIIDDMFSYIPKMTRKRSFSLDQGPLIHMNTAMFMQLIQCSVELPPKDEHVTEDGAITLSDERQTSSNIYTLAINNAKNIVQLFLTLSSKPEESDLKYLLQIFVEDLLVCLNIPEWPSAETFLSYIAHSLPYFISNRQELSLSLDFVSICVELLGMVSSKVRKMASSSIDIPLRDLKSDVLDYLSLRYDSNDVFKYSRQFWICQWYIEDATSDYIDFYRFQWDNRTRVSQWEDLDRKSVV